MAFTREELSEQEKKPQTPVGDDVSPFTGKTPAEEAASDSDPDADPSGDGGTQTDPDDAGDGGNGGETTGDSPTSTDADPSGETDSNGGEQSGGEPVKPVPKKGSAAERIQELVDERDGYRAYGEYAEKQIQARDKELSELRAKVPATAAKPAVKEEPDEPFPKLEDPDVDYDSVKLEAKVKGWTNKKIEKAKAANPAPQTGANDPKAVETAFMGRVGEYVKTHTDFETTVKTLPPLAPQAAAVVILGEDGPALLYYLGKHRKDAVRIAQLPERDQLMELGYIRAQLKESEVLPPNQGDKPAAKGGDLPAPGAKSQAKPKTPSGAPTPPNRVTGGGTSQTRDIQDPNLDMAEFARRHREARVKGREAARTARGLR